MFITYERGFEIAFNTFYDILNYTKISTKKRFGIGHLTSIDENLLHENMNETYNIEQKHNTNNSLHQNSKLKRVVALLITLVCFF